MTERSIDQHRLAWDTKPALRAVYGDYHRLMARHCVPGATLEIGGGSGHMKAFAPDVVSIDIQQAPWIDVVADAHALPFAGGRFHNVVLLDVLHHLRFPLTFLKEAARVLAPGGRLVIMEPAMTPLSAFMLDRFHEEPVDLTADPFTDTAQSGPRPEDSNQAISHLLFRRSLARTLAQVPELGTVSQRLYSLWAYPLSGGFQNWSLIPGWLVKPVLTIERAVLPLLGPLMAFRLLTVLERR